jgi:hypothetical protein
MYREMATEMAACQAFGIGDKNGKFKALDFHYFQYHRLAKQGLVYSVADCHYPGDSKMQHEG